MADEATQGAIAQPTGQGESTGADGFWGNFPDVPEEQRPLLEPHLKNVQGHVTKLEQQYSPFKQIADAGYTPEDLQGLISFSQNFDNNPLAMWLQLGQSLQQQGVLHQDLDFDTIQAIADGSYVDPDGTVEGGELPVGEGVDPAVAELQQRLQQLEAEREQEKITAQQAAENQALEQALDKITTTLTSAGFDESLVSEEMLVGALISHRGDADKVIQQLTGLREGVLKGHVAQQTKEKADVNMPNGVPKAPSKLNEKPGDQFRGASQAAEQYLRSAQTEAAQG